MKSQTVSRCLSVCTSMIIAGTLIFPSACTKKENPFRVTTTFVIGTATIERAGEPARPLRHKEDLKPGDKITTGHESMVVIQFGQDSLLKIEPDSILNMPAFTDKGETRLTLEQGKLFTRLHRLSKGSTFKVYTQTSLAAVRGTEFSVSSGKKNSTVAVNDGAVEVTKLNAEGRETEGKTVEKGKAAVVTKTITIRPTTAEEKKEFRRLEKITIIIELDNKSEAELKQMEDEYQKNKDSIEDTEKLKDSKNDKKKKKENADDKAAADDKQADNVSPEDTILWTSKKEFSATDPIIVHYKNMPEYRTCWIDISRATDSDGRYLTYQWTYSAKDGQMTFAGLNLQPGTYEARAHFNRRGSADKRCRFEVK